MYEGDAGKPTGTGDIYAIWNVSVPFFLELRLKGIRLLVGFAILGAGLLPWYGPGRQRDLGRVLSEAQASAAGLESTVSTGEWPTVAANPQRTSWTPEEVRGQLQPIWYRPIEPYISPKSQVIAANDLLYVSTARGLYALHTGAGATGDAGELAWIYPTELPLGHSATIHEGVAYVGGMDHKLHAIDASTGAGLCDARVAWS